MKYRAYFFVNMYLSDIQKGIQSAHCAVDLVMKYPNASHVSQWATVDKTMIVLNGGNAEKLRTIYEELQFTTFPFAKFHEDDASLNGALTCVGTIVPEMSIFELVETSLYTSYDIIFFEELYKFKLA